MTITFVGARGWSEGDGVWHLVGGLSEGLGFSYTRAMQLLADKRTRKASSAGVPGRADQSGRPEVDGVHSIPSARLLLGAPSNQS